MADEEPALASDSEYTETETETEEDREEGSEEAAGGGEEGAKKKKKKKKGARVCMVAIPSFWLPPSARAPRLTLRPLA
jgi:hypothetical protein